MFDILVIGGGPAGIAAALQAAELGARTAIVERERLGGTCTNDSCVPTRVLAHAARLVREASQFVGYGLGVERLEVDFAGLMRRTQEMVYRVHERKQWMGELQEAGVAVFANADDAWFVDPHSIRLGDGQDFSADRLVICTGGYARRLDFPGCEHVLTHSDVWALQRVPSSLAIVGAAATGCQLASIFAACRARVTLLDAAPRMLPQEDERISSEIRRAFSHRGIDVLCGITGPERIEHQGGGLRLDYTGSGGPRSVLAEAVVMAADWPGTAGRLNLAVAGVATSGGYVTVDDSLRTTAAHIYAAGDITGRAMLVQNAEHEARLAAENAVRGTARVHNPDIVPHGGFTDPEYGSVGLTAQQARQAGGTSIVVPYTDLDRAVIDGRTEGFFQLHASRETHRLLGAQAVGEQAVEVVQLVAAGIAAGMTVEQLADPELAYPTFMGIAGLAAQRLVRTALRT